jgi:hypothetical protein
MSSAVASWLILPTPDDSLEFFAIAAAGPSATPLVTLGIRGLRQFWQEHLPGLTAPFLRQRLSSRGTYTLVIDLDTFDPKVGMPYELRVREAHTKQPYIASSVRLALTDTSAQYQVTSVRFLEATKAALVQSGVYRLLGLAQDTLLVCKLPCRVAKRVPLTGPAATITF